MNSFMISKAEASSHYSMVLKNDLKRLFFKDILFILLRLIRIFGYILLFEQPSTKRIIEFIKLMPTAIRKRKIIMKNRSVTDSYIEQWFL